MSFCIVLHFTLITAIICLVLVQRSAESSILVSSSHFAPGGANKLLVKITRILVAIFMVNCLFISYLKYGNHGQFNSNERSLTTEQSASVPVE